MSGWCFGGLVAFEMAQQLVRMGERVEMLAMLNAPSGPEFETRFAGPKLAPIADRASSRWKEFRSLPIGRKLTYAAGKLKGQIAWRSLDLYQRTARFTYRSMISVRQLVYSYYIKRRIPLPDHMRNRYFIFANSRLERRYKQQRYSGHILVFRDQLPYPVSAQGWGRFTRNIEVMEIPVSVEHHRGLLQEPAAGLLAQKIKEYLNRRTSLRSAVSDAA